MSIPLTVVSSQPQAQTQAQEEAEATTQHSNGHGHGVATSVITSEPTPATATAPSTASTAATLEVNGSGDGHRSSSTSTLGVYPLLGNNVIAVKQRIRLCEIFALCSGCETEKKYTIHGSSGNILYWAKEQSNPCMRLCCGTVRGLKLTLQDAAHQNVIRLVRPLSCERCCCNACYPRCTQEMSVQLNGINVGCIRERATWCYPVYHVFDRQGRQSLKIRGPFFTFSCGSDIDYSVTNTDGTEVAVVTKKWLGICQETAWDADSFVITYKNTEMGAEQRAIILAAAFLIDLMYYEADG